MNVKKAITTGVITGAITLAIAGANAANAAEHETNKEKCFGVAKAGQNDCAAIDKSHSCMGHATVDGDSKEWIAVPKGLCEKLVGGSLTAGKDDAKASCQTKASCQGKDDHEG